MKENLVRTKTDVKPNITEVFTYFRWYNITLQEKGLRGNVNLRELLFFKALCAIIDIKTKSKITKVLSWLLRRKPMQRNCKAVQQGQHHLLCRKLDKGSSNKSLNPAMAREVHVDTETTWRPYCPHLSKSVSNSNSSSNNEAVQKKVNYNEIFLNLYDEYDKYDIYDKNNGDNRDNSDNVDN
ncbi:hypothetical protein H8356DRAFT_1426785 [Neocallimastix lanati (nom. inval.)]|nr:hypothetical protein H8356DRAFT_1426785 [Neocallimastix sp. JGI-2020a]